MDTRADRFPLFDSVRGIAAMCVLVAHVGFFGNLFELDTFAKRYTARLEIGVAMFFLISAFLIYRPFAAVHLREQDPLRLATYAWRRVLRVLPGYWVALTAVALWLGSSGYLFSLTPITPTFSGEGIVAYYGLTQLYFEDARAGGLPQAWTLSVEASFYAFIPLWAWGMRRLHLRRPSHRLGTELCALAGLAGLSLLYKLVIVESGAAGEIATTPTALLSSLPAYLDMFALGMALAVASVRVQDLKLRTRLLDGLERWPAVPWIAAGILFVVLSTQLGFTGEPRETMSSGTFFVRHLLLAAIAALVLLPAIFGDVRRGLVRRVLGSKPLLYVGLISYGIYGYHLAVIIQLVRWGYDGEAFGHPWLGWLIVTVPASIALGTVSYYVVERPALSLKRLVPDRRAAPDQPGAVSAPSAPPAVRG